MSNINVSVVSENNINADIQASDNIRADISSDTPIEISIGSSTAGSVSVNASTEWMYLATGFKAGTEPTLNAAQPSGAEVYDYTYDTASGTTTRYRYIADDGSIDAFYTGWDGATATGLVATKSITI